MKKEQMEEEIRAKISLLRGQYMVNLASYIIPSGQHLEVRLNTDTMVLTAQLVEDGEDLKLLPGQLSVMSITEPVHTDAVLDAAIRAYTRHYLLSILQRENQK